MPTDRSFQSRPSPPVPAGAPALGGWVQLTPIVGAAALVAALLWRRPERHALTSRAPTMVRVVGATVTAVVLVFALWWHKEFIALPAGSISWSRPQAPVEGLPQLLGALVVAAAVNSLFEELMWRAAFADMPGAISAGGVAGDVRRTAAHRQWRSCRPAHGESLGASSCSPPRG